jgi:hypothetical protein
MRYFSDVFLLKRSHPMADQKQESPECAPIPDFAERSSIVLKVELEHYLKNRRTANGIREEATPDNLAGLCVSGGGVRSATLGLGLFQALIKARKFKYFDYLSTVSGGGYIGACLSSLMSKEPARRDKSWNSPRPLLNNNRRFEASGWGLEEENSPFTNEKYEYPKLEAAKMTTKHQLIHLRQYGEYLTPNRGPFSWDINRAFGALTAGIVLHLSMFLILIAVVVLIHHGLFAWMSDGQLIRTLQDPVPTVNPLVVADYERDAANYTAWRDSLARVGELARFHAEEPRLDTFTPVKKICPTDADWGKLSSSQQFDLWLGQQLLPQFGLIWFAAKSQWPLVLGFFAIGLLLGFVFIRWASTLPFKTAQQEQQEQDFGGARPESQAAKGAPYRRPISDDMLTLVARPFVRWFNALNFFVAPALAYGLVILLAQHGVFLAGADYFVALALPFCYSLGLFVSIYALISLYFVNNGRERVSGWLYRSFYNGLQGGALLGLLVAALFPVIIILLFGKHGIAVKLSTSFVPVIVAYYFTVQSFGGGQNGFVTKIVQRLQMPLLNISILLFVGLALAWVSTGLYNWETDLEQWLHWQRGDVVGALLACFALALLVLGMAANTNDISLHYFYRDRLSEAYLRTNGKVDISQKEDEKELLKVNLRNHEDLTLNQLGEGNGRAPYHLIVAALNLQGSHDLAFKTLRSEHFIFSKYFIGSRNTGYVSTNRYRSTKLSTAMTISAAAVASGMGALSFAASNFYMTLLNIRTGYWMYNPKQVILAEKARKEREEAAKTAALSGQRPSTWQNLKQWCAQKWRAFDEWRNKYPLWLLYLGRELAGKLSADTRRVYVSDGGHTGDNLGLLPLVQRRCSTIVIADFEEDQKYSFGSFNQAVRLAKAIYNADIEINLVPLLPKEDEHGIRYSPASVAQGYITYHEEDKDTQKIVKKTGRVIYLKSSMSLLKEMAESYDEATPPPALTEFAPVYVLNYFRNNPGFPHQSTADQYFDENQFEAYRMLGEHIGKQAEKHIQFGPLVSESRT